MIFEGARDMDIAELRRASRVFDGALYVMTVGTFTVLAIAMGMLL